MRRFGCLDGHGFPLDFACFSRLRSSFDGRKLRRLAKLCEAYRSGRFVKRAARVWRRGFGIWRRDASLNGLDWLSIVARIDIEEELMIVPPRTSAPVALALAIVLMSWWCGVVLAQDYPAHPVKIIVPFGAGGPADVYSRVLAHHLSEALKQPFVVEDRPGAGSIIGTDAVAKSPPDGYTLLAMSNTHTTNESLIANKPFQLMRDFVPVAGINYSDLVMVIHP